MEEQKLNNGSQPALQQTDVMGSTHLIVLKDWVTPYNSVKKGNHAPAYYWAEKLGKTEEKFIKDFIDGYLDEWFKLHYT